MLEQVSHRLPGGGTGAFERFVLFCSFPLLHLIASSTTAIGRLLIAIAAKVYIIAFCKDNILK